MTNAIGSGTANIAVNVPKDERDFWGKLAFQEGRSIGELQRRYVLKGLEAESATDAARLRDIRRRYYGVFMLGIFIIGITADLRIEARRTVREERIEEVGEA